MIDDRTTTMRRRQRRRLQINHKRGMPTNHRHYASLDVVGFMIVVLTGLVIHSKSNNNVGIAVDAERNPPPPPPPPRRPPQPPPPRQGQKGFSPPSDDFYYDNDRYQDQDQMDDPSSSVQYDDLYGYGAGSTYGDNHDDGYTDKSPASSSYPGFPSETSAWSPSGSYDDNGFASSDDGNDNYSRRSSDPGQHPSPSISQLPIHYEFEAKKTTPMSRDLSADIDINSGNDDDRFRTTGSARRDLVTRYWSTKLGKLQIMSTTAALGAALGTFLSKSFIPLGGDELWASFFGVCLCLSTLFRTPLGELSRALGLSLLLVFQRTTKIRRDYPTWRYIPPALGLRGHRGIRPFPPTRNPWRYVPRSDRDPDFNMMYAIVAMAFVGSACGGNLPFIPSWIGALIGASLFGLACTWTSPRGDLARTCGMRVVSTAGQLWEIQADLQIIPKATVVSSQIIDRAMILDRKHKVKDRFLALASKGYDQATKVAAQIQQQQRGGINNVGYNKSDDDRDIERDRGNRRRRPEDRDSLGRDRDRGDRRYETSLDDRRDENERRGRRPSFDDIDGRDPSGDRTGRSRDYERNNDPDRDSAPLKQQQQQRGGFWGR